jgi:hypothetical protein
MWQDAPLPEIDLETDVDMKETLRQFLQYVKLSKVSGRIIKHNYSPQSGTRASYKVRKHKRLLTFLVVKKKPTQWNV